MTLLSMVRPFLLAVAFVVLSVLAAGPAHADFRLCNNTSSRVGVSVGYRDQQGWLTEGWWNVSARSCEAILKGPLAAAALAWLILGEAITQAQALGGLVIVAGIWIARPRERK